MCTVDTNCSHDSNKQLDNVLIAHVVCEPVMIFILFSAEVACIRPFVCVRSHVRIEVALVRKHSGTPRFRASVMMFACVNGHVSRETALCYETLATFRTHIRPITCMRSQMLSEMALSRKAFATTRFGTCTWAHMCVLTTHMRREVIFVGKLLSAIWFRAYVRRLSRVCPTHMGSQPRLVCALVFAVRTLHPGRY